MKLDDWLIDNVFQRFAHWFQRMTGKDNFYLATCSGMISVLVGFYINALLNSHPIDYLITCSMVGVIIGSSIISKKRYEGENRGTLTPTLNSERNRTYPTLFRVLFLGVGFGHIIILISIIITASHWSKILEEILLEVLLLGFIGHLYFVACTPLPPQKGKIGELIRSFGKALKECVPSPGGREPVPAPT